MQWEKKKTKYEIISKTWKAEIGNPISIKDFQEGENRDNKGKKKTKT